ncbi:aminotransferase class I/II-fold pyridoxal phosphate-dependent enzyme [Azohydromonas sp. G-1-1-14]|uniref:histidinol-phosphate transaminase n=2 Tax=Azohydromonas caseinilytica TaxID=2728836 RepID=A0A848F8Y3_9BURK|nr:aminotransferase class I/II-fold pyridoxal phosphate-dependent enzyme [Azohydromonas caseinilytica]
MGEPLAVPVVHVEHGGPDGGAPVRWDFSTNANPLPPPAPVLRALRDADRGRYPDPQYGALRQGLGAFLGVAPGRVLPTAGSSEGIRRLTLAARLQGVSVVWVPQPGYGDYRAAAQALGLEVRGYTSAGALLDGLQRGAGRALVWLCEPCNPTGATLPAAFWPALQEMAQARGAWLALDRAYEPLRLWGQDPVPDAVAQSAWQLGSPNKALGLTGVRAGWIVAPGDGELGAALLALAPSWVLSAEGVEFLKAWTLPQTQQVLAAAREQLKVWKRQQWAALQALGWKQQPSVVPFWLAAPGFSDKQRQLLALRERGVKLRDATSFGLPGWVRVSVQPPQAQRALAEAWGEA